MSKTIFLSAGHSRTDPGAVANGRREADIVVEFRNMVELYLRRDPRLSVRIDGDYGLDNWPLAKAVTQVKAADLAVEFHCNAASASATGVETLSHPRHFELGRHICAAIASHLGIRNRGAKPENAGQHSRLAFVQAGGIIVEILFITSRSDLAAYDDRKWLAAREVARVLLEHVT